MSFVEWYRYFDYLLFNFSYIILCTSYSNIIHHADSVMLRLSYVLCDIPTFIMLLSSPNIIYVLPILTLFTMLIQ